MIFGKYEENIYDKIHKNIKYAASVIIICTASTVLSILLRNLGIDKENALMLCLVGVLIVTSVAPGYIYGAVAAVLSVLLFNYFFTEPIHSFIISSNQDFILIIFFLIASLISSTMTTKLKHQTFIAKRNEETARLLYEISKGFLYVTGKENIISKGIKYIYDYAEYKCYIKLNTEDKIFSAEGLPEYDKSIINFYKIPIKGLANQIGEMKIINVSMPIPSQKEMIIKTIVYQMAIALDREFIYNERENIRIAMESEHLKSTLLRSISHDLRTPLTGIKGASELILDSYEKLDASSVKKLVSDINEESTWLINTVQNILNMTRISEGKLTVNKNYEAVDDLISQALILVPKLLSSGRLHVSTLDDIVLVKVDGRLIVQVLVNLLDNAFKYSGENSEIFLNTYYNDKNIVFEVSDNGKGIDPSIKNSIFDSFVTHSKINSADANLGFGLGLSICKAIVSAHDGTIAAENKSSGGAVFRVELPLGDD